MVWTPPRTYTAGELMTATIGNTHWRDNLQALYDYIGGAQDYGANWTIAQRALLLKHSAVAHGMTSVLATDVYAAMQILSGTLGGVAVSGVSDGDATGMRIDGYVGTATPTSTTAPIVLNAAKKNVATTQAMASGETLLAIFNNATTEAARLSAHGTGYALRMPTGNSWGRVQGLFQGSAASHDYLYLSANYVHTGTGTGTVDNASLGTAEVEVRGTNAGSGRVTLKAGAVNTAPIEVMTLDNTTLTVAAGISVGIASPTPTRRLELVGSGSAEVGSPADAGNKTGTFRVTMAGLTAGQGGAIEFGYAFGTASQAYFAAIKGLGTSTTTNTTGDLAFYVRLQTGNTALIECARFTTNGTETLFGIGTIAPTRRLHVEGTTNPAIGPPADSGSKAATILIVDTNGAGGAGGCIEFGGVAGKYHAAIKGQLSNSASNTVGDLVFHIRNVGTDVVLKECGRINANGRWGFGDDYWGIVGLNPATTVHIAATDAQLTVERYSADAIGAALNLRKARGTIRASLTQTLANDVIGTIDFQSMSTTSVYASSAQVTAAASENIGNTARGGKLILATVKIGTTFVTTRVTVEDNGNVGINGTSYGASSVGVLGIANAATLPTGNPTGGGILYADAGAGKWRGSGGTTTTFGAADPHCPTCDRDFASEWENEKYGRLAVCHWCLLESIEELVAESAARGGKATMKGIIRRERRA